MLQPPSPSPLPGGCGRGGGRAPTQSAFPPLWSCGVGGWLSLDLLIIIKDSLCFIMSFNEFFEGLNTRVHHQASVYADP